ncbi:MAG: hypothetical protein AAF542_17610 [Pseudomonadota bacterium]
MKNEKTKAHSFVPGVAESRLHAMAGDDCSLHFDLEELTPKQQRDHEENQALTGMLQLALIGIGNSGDHFALFDEFGLPDWASLLEHYQECYGAMGLYVAKDSDISFHPRDNFYESVAENWTSVTDCKLINLYMVSGGNQLLHQSSNALQVSKNVNSKVHFAEHAPQFGLPVPDTLCTECDQLGSAVVEDFFSRHNNQVMLKLLGLAGSRNVIPVNSVAMAVDYTAEYSGDMPVLLQHQLDTTDWQEMTVDLTITDESVEISNVRRILFSDGQWVGNQLGERVQLQEKHRSQLLRVGEYARHHGYSAAEGLNCGIDYFVRGDDVLITEINARWTGGLFPAEYCRRLDTHRNAIAFFDMVRRDRIEDITRFQRDHLFNTRKSAEYAYIPMGFSPYTNVVDDIEYVYLWQLVVGDFSAFQRHIAHSFEPGVFLVAPGINV